MMTIGDHADLLAVGYLLNQHMLQPDDEITGIDYEEDIETIVVRTARETDYKEKLKKKIQTSGCAQGTVFGDLMENFDKVALSTEAQVRTAIRFAFEHLKLVVEPGGVVALAKMLAEPARFSGGQIGVILSGGNIDPALFIDILSA